MVPTAAPVSGARGNHEEEPAEPAKPVEPAEPAKPVEPAEPARPAEPEPVKARAQDPEKVKEAEPEKKQDKPEAKPAEQADERPLQERVPVADPQPKPDGNETEEPKSKAKPAPKPGLVDKFRSFLFGRAPPSQQDSTGPGAWLPSLGQFECIFTLSIMDSYRSYRGFQILYWKQFRDQTDHACGCRTSCSRRASWCSVGPVGCSERSGRATECGSCYSEITRATRGSTRTWTNTSNSCRILFWLFDFRCILHCFSLFSCALCWLCFFFTVLLCCSSSYLFPAALDANFVFYASEPRTLEIVGPKNENLVLGELSKNDRFSKKTQCFSKKEPTFFAQLHYVYKYLRKGKRLQIPMDWRHIIPKPSTQ